MSEKRFSILLIDDSPEDRETLRRWLQGDPDYIYDVREAETGEEGLSELSRHMPDCVVCDHDLPDSTSFDLLAHLQAEIDGSPCPLVVITGMGNEALAVKSLKQGALDYIPKERMTSESVRQAVRNALEKFRLLRQIDGQQRELERLYRCEQQRTIELEQRVRERDQFLAMLSHELRNPLSAVVTASKLLNHPDLDRAGDLQARTIIDRQVGQLTRLLDDLLDVSRVTLGKIELRLTLVDLNQIVEDAVRSVSALAERSNVGIEIGLCDIPVTVEGDSARLQQVQSNLLNNAIKFSKPGSKVRLEIVRESQIADGVGAWAVVRVTDQGIGIAPDMINRIFDLFVTSEQHLDRSKGGMGVGLTLVRALAELHGGRVSVQSAGVGRGSCFEVRLPLANSAPTAIANPGLEKRNAARRQVIVVEDQEANRLMLTKLLELQGHDVSSAENGLEGYELIDRIHPDVAILDIGLPELDGYRLAERIRQNPALQAVVLVALTGYGQPGDVDRAHQAGFNHHLTKPLNRVALERILESLPT